MSHAISYAHLLSLFSLSKAATTRALDISEVVLLSSCALLIFGVAGEYLEDHKKLPRWIKWPRVAFEIIVAVSLGIEFFADSGVFLASRHLGSIDDNTAQTLRVRAEHEIDLRLAMEKQLVAMGPRHVLLYGENAHELTKILVPFKGQKAEVRVCDLVPKNLFRPGPAEETMQLAMRLQYILSDESKWSVGQLADENCTGAAGVSVSVNSKALEETRRAATALVHALAAVPLVVSPTETVVTSDTPRSPQPTVYHDGKKVPFAPLGTDTVVVTVFAHPL